MPRWYSVAEAAKALNVTTARVYQLIGEGKLWTICNKPVLIHRHAINYHQTAQALVKIRKENKAKDAGSRS